MSSRATSPAVTLTLTALVNVFVVTSLHRLLPQYVTVFGGIPAAVIIGSLLTLLNLFLRPILTIITFPFRLFFTLVTIIVVNAGFLWIVYQVVLRMDPSIVVLVITGGMTGWIVVSMVLGIANWVVKSVLHG